MNEQAELSVPDSDRLLGSLPLAVILLGPSLTIASANPEAEQFLGQSARRLVGRDLSEVIAFSETAIMERLREKETPISAREIDAIVPGLGPRRVDVTVAPVADKPGWQLVTLHDNSTIEALGEDSGSIGDSVLRGPEILAHEIKNPLAGIRGAAQLLARKVKGKDRSLTDLIASEVDRIANLIEQMQLLSGKTTAPVQACNLHEITRKAISVIEAAEKTSARNLGIEEEFDPSLPDVLGNQDSMVQILINLISNAREANSDNAKARIIVRTRFASGLQLHEPRSRRSVRLPVELRISDNGPGVDPSLRDHIFEPFVTTKKSGQGLGLALVRKLVRDMSGRISHERDETNGWTHFRIHLPLAVDTVSSKSRRRQTP